MSQLITIIVIVKEVDEQCKYFKKLMSSVTVEKRKWRVNNLSHIKLHIKLCCKVKIKIITEFVVYINITDSTNYCTIFFNSI